MALLRNEWVSFIKIIGISDPTHQSDVVIKRDVDNEALETDMANKRL